ncbi:MAG: type II secretion system protein [Verrucomicrobiales bacterium]
MKTHRNSRRASGFTLIELLVVVAIIASLSGIAFVAVNAGLSKARQAKGRVAATNLANALDAFYTDYNRLPDLPSLAAPEGGQTNDDEGRILLSILLGEETEEAKEENPRRIQYLQIEDAKGQKGGLYYDESSREVLALYDPFGEPYTVILNTDYEDALEFTYNNKEYSLRGKNIVVYSFGADKEEGTSDDILTFVR